MNFLRNFSFVSKENPVFGPITKSQLIYMFVFTSFPGGFFIVFMMLDITIGMFLFAILSILALGLGYFFAKKRIDGRDVRNFLIDKYRKKNLIIRKKEIKIKTVDIDKMIEDIKK